MVQATDNAGFGRRAGAAAPKPATPAPSWDEPTNPILKFLDRTFLWLPNEEAPGFPAVCLFLLRQVTLPIVLMIAPFVVLGLAAQKINLFPMASTPSGDWFATAFLFFIFGCIAVVQELGRYSFVRHAERPLRALSIFTALIVVLIAIFDHSRLYTFVWMVAAQLVASAVIVLGLRHRAYIGAVVVALIIGQTTMGVTAPRLFPAPHKTPSSAGQQASSAAPAAAVSDAAPSAGDMQSWAKLYPGAVVTKNETQKLLGLTDWRVQFTAQASPEQIGAFYQNLANSEGFTDTQTVLGLHVFTQPSTNNRFSYAVIQDGANSLVIFEARTFAGNSPG